MTRRRFLALMLGVLGFSSLVTISAQGPQGPQGPDDKGAVFRSPFDEPTPARPAPSAPPAARPPQTASAAMKSFFPEAKSFAPMDPNGQRSLNPNDTPDINRDLQVPPEAGPWMIMIIGYRSNTAAVQARKMCMELRNTNRVPAYVFAYGAEERRKEYERAKAIYDRQQAFFKERGQWPEEPLRLRVQHIDVNHAVLMGGYPDVDAANRALAQVKSWKLPDPTKVDLDVGNFWAPKDANNVDLANLANIAKDKNRVGQAEAGYVNPFKRAFVCRNPAVKQQAAPEAKVDITLLKRLNSDEPHSLLSCNKPFSLAVKEFKTPHTVQDRASSANLLEKLGFGGKTEHQDFARISAHNLVDVLRKQKVEAYVLHSKFESTVTVGSYDSPTDPALLSMQEMLATRLNQQPFTQIQFFSRPIPMAVPR
jgi:hypothetical protein